MMKLGIIIPVYNEGLQIGALLDELKAGNYEVILIDDGSTDGSGAIAREKGVTVITHDQKKGKGFSLQDGFRYALTKEYDAVITMDGDRQHDVADIASLVQTAETTGADIVTGTRMAHPEGMPLVRLWTNLFMSWMISTICRQTIPDTQCGFRLIRSKVLAAIRLASTDFQIETEVLIKASRRGFKIHSVPIKTIYRNEVSKINPLLDTARFFVYIIKEILSRS